MTHYHPVFDIIYGNGGTGGGTGDSVGILNRGGIFIFEFTDINMSPRAWYSSISTDKINYHTCQDHQQPKVDMYVYGGWPSNRTPNAFGIYGDNDYISSHFSFDVSSPALNNYHTRDLVTVTTHSEVTGGSQKGERSPSRNRGVFCTNDVTETHPYFDTGSPHMASEAISSIF